MAWVRVDHVWKRFLLHQDRADSVGQLVVRMLPGRRRYPRSQPFWALQDVSVEMPAGTSLGVIGSNGSGKSSLLKLLTQTMQPTSGRITVHGKVSALIELGAGFHPDFTGRENIVLSGSILGFRRREIERRMEDIIDFAGIRPFIDTPVKYYSSGMNARLGFSVAIHVEPEILIVDEVLAVGDEAFNRQCMERIFQMKREGVGILLVSHDLVSIERLMDRVMWLEKGVVRAEGSPQFVVHAYQSHVQGQQEQGEQVRQNGPVEPARDVALAGHIAVGGRPVDFVSREDPVELMLEWDNHTHQSLLGHVVLGVRRPDGLEIAQFSTLEDGKTLLLPPGRSSMTLRWSELYLPGGTYEVDASFVTEEGRRLPEWRPLLQFQVRSASSGGLLLVPHQWELPVQDGAALSRRSDP